MGEPDLVVEEEVVQEVLEEDEYDEVPNMNPRQLTVERSTATAHRLSEYDGVCGNVHGHNINWEVSLNVHMTDESHNMPLDFKEVAELLDRFDHALTLAHTDEMLEIDPVWGGVKEDAEYPIEYQSEVYGQVWVFEGDPTCEILAQYVADELVAIEDVFDVEVMAYETDKYGMQANSW